MAAWEDVFRAFSLQSVVSDNTNRGASIAGLTNAIQVPSPIHRGEMLLIVVLETELRTGCRIGVRIDSERLNM